VGTALGDILPLAVAAAIRPGTVVAIALLLTTSRGRTLGLAFTAGFMVSIATLSAVLLVIADSVGAHDAGTPARWVSVMKIVLGVALLALAGRTWTALPPQGEGVPQRWLDAIDGIGTRRAAALGAGVGALNGKNLILTAAAALTVAQTGIRAIEQIVPMVVYVAIAGLCVLAPVALYLVLGDRADPMLEALRGWLVRHGAAIMGILFLLIGFSLVGDGIRELAGG
jgi:hypothetical protein